MASRMFCHAAVLQLRMACKQLPIRQGSAIWCRQTYPAACERFVYRAQRLHVKVYDKDAGFQRQREGNSSEETEDSSFVDQHISGNILTKTAKRRVGKLLVEEANETPSSQISSTLEAGKGESLTAVNDPDTFGNAKQVNDDEDAGDRLEEEYISRPTRRSRKLDTRQYAHLIKEHLNAHRLKEAIDVLEKRMLKEDRAKPENYIYNLLISGCAKEGYTRKAFSLFTKMRQRNLKVTGGTYTSLFNACANAPSAVDGLGRANHLREVMLEQSYEPNVKNYNAMIKAYGRCGDVKTAYLLADEMLERSLVVGTDTFNFLLQACASDKEYGFRHSLLTWHKMLRRNIQPDYYTFHTLLRCARDCSFGDLQSMQQVLQQLLQHQQEIYIGGHSKLPILEQSIKSSVQTEGKLLTTPPTMQHSAPEQSLEVASEATQLELPNLLATRPHLGSLVTLAEVNRPHDRFLLLGGLAGYLELLKQHKVTPNIEIFTTMLEVIPPTNAAEKQLLTYIRRIGLKADIDFFNVLIKKRSMRFDYEGAKEGLSMIRTAGLHPDIITYGVLALGCQTADAARELLQKMLNNSVRLNIQILGAMLRQGCAQKAFPYVNEIMQISLDEQIRPNDVFLRHLHNFYNQCARAIDARHPFTKTKHFKKEHAQFCDKLRLYYDEQGIGGLKLEDAIKKIRQNPYEQYKENSIDGVEPLKNERQAKKQKLRKYIKKIKIENLRGDDEAARTINKTLE